MKDVGGRRDGVGAKEKRQFTLSGGCYQSENGRVIAGNVPVGSAANRCLFDHIAGAEEFGGFSEMVPVLQYLDIGCRNVRILCELLLKKGNGWLHRPAVHPEKKPQDEHVLAAFHVLVGEAAVGQALMG